MATFLQQPNDRRDDPRPRKRVKNIKPLVLVAEDHDDTRFMLMYLLEIRGYRVALAGDGEAAVRMAEQMCPDLILMDASLPRLDGLAATRRIRETSALARVPVIFLSGHAHPSFRAVALETGGDDYLVKPLELAQLERVLERHLPKSGAGKAD
jgi:DNA-binding response OmpR family regulator